MNVTVTGIPCNAHKLIKILLYFILCVHVPVGRGRGRGRGRKNTGSVVAINYLTQLQLDLFQPTKRLTEMEIAILNC